jgi:hypothetical protein
MAFSCLNPSAWCPYVVNHRHCWTIVLAVLCCKLNKYCAYLAISATLNGSRALRVGHGHKALLPLRVLLIMNWEEHIRHLDSGGEAALTQGGEGDECRLLDGVVELAADDDPHPQVHGVEWYHQADLPYVQTMGHRPAAAVERFVVPVVAETMECIVQHSCKLRAVLARGNKPPVLGEGEVGVVVHIHVKTQP